MTTYSEMVFKKEFSNKVSKQAYLNACVWLAKNVYGKSDYAERITVKIEKKDVKKTKVPTFVVSLYVTINENELKNDFCQKCQQLHTLFYCVDKVNCEECKMASYRKQLNSYVKNLKEHFEEVFES